MSESIIALSTLDGRYIKATKQLRPFFSEFGLIRFRVLVEAKWVKFLSTLGIKGFPELSSNDIAFLSKLERIALEDAERVKQIEEITNHDLKAVEYFIREEFDKSGSLSLADAKEYVHFACTSEDINNLAYGMILKSGIHEILRPQMIEVMRAFGELAYQWSDVPMLSLTHGQPATPTTVGKEFGLFGVRLLEQLKKLDNIEIKGKFNGAVGNFNAHIVACPDLNWPQIANDFVSSLGLVYQPYSTQIECHDYFAEICDCLCRFQTILFGACQDIWTYISRNRLILKKVEGEVGSSTMPHKVNPIDFENAEGNLGLANSLFKFFASKLPVSRMQRDLSDSTVMRNVGIAFGFSVVALLSLKKGLGKIDIDSDVLKKELDEHCEVLAEPIQTVLRKENFENPYELLKKHTRGEIINKDKISSIILECFPDSSQSRLALESLSPSSYTGIASKLALEMAKSIFELQ